MRINVPDYIYEESRKLTNNFRKSLGMRKIKRGKRECLGCEKPFKSQDVRNNRLCDKCKIKNHE